MLAAVGLTRTSQPTLEKRIRNPELTRFIKLNKAQTHQAITDRNFLFSPSNVPRLPTLDLGLGTIDSRPIPST